MVKWSKLKTLDQEICGSNLDLRDNKCFTNNKLIITTKLSFLSIWIDSKLVCVDSLQYNNNNNNNNLFLLSENLLCLNFLDFSSFFTFLV